MRRFRFHEQRIIRLGAGVVLFALAGSSYGFGWTLVNAKIRQDFPEVKRITTAELVAWLEDEERVVPLLLDVRTKAEFERSHLRNAQQIAPIAPGPLLQEVKDRPIVTYCSGGLSLRRPCGKITCGGILERIEPGGLDFSLGQ